MSETLADCIFKIETAHNNAADTLEGILKPFNYKYKGKRVFAREIINAISEDSLRRILTDGFEEPLDN